MVEVLGRRALNRATLARQRLLDHSDEPLADVLAGVAGLQAQAPQQPHVGLWSRIRRYDPADLDRALTDRHAVRMVALRGTLHLVTTDDALTFRPHTQPVLERELATHAEHRAELARLSPDDVEAVLEAGRELLSAAPRTAASLRSALAERFPGRDPGALALLCRNRLALVHAPPRGLWRRSGPLSLVTLEAWSGRPVDTDGSLVGLLRRYLAAFGPATAADFATWTGLTGVREVVDRARPDLRTFRDEAGRELVDLPDAPRPDPDRPVPVRFTPQFDNVLLSHADRTRVLADEHRRVLYPHERSERGHVFVDGFVHGTWRRTVEAGGGTAIVSVRPLGATTARVRASIAAEGRRLARFLEPDATGHEVRVGEPG